MEETRDFQEGKYNSNYRLMKRAKVAKISNWRGVRKQARTDSRNLFSYNQKDWHLSEGKERGNSGCNF